MLSINDCYGEQITAFIQDEWLSADGKVLRGTLKSGEKQAIIHVVSHESRIDVAQACQAGDKSSEITVMRELMKETGLEKAKMSLDAHHCNPETMTQIEQAGGQYLIQIKENLPKLLDYCRDLGSQSSLAETVDYDSSRGLVCTREAHYHPLDLSNIDRRWNTSGLRTLIVMNRETFNKATQEMTSDTSYYLSNYENAHQQHTVDHLAKTIRGHWVVESNNWATRCYFW